MFNLGKCLKTLSFSKIMYCTLFYDKLDMLEAAYVYRHVYRDRSRGVLYFVELPLPIPTDFLFQGEGYLLCIWTDRRWEDAHHDRDTAEPGALRSGCKGHLPAARGPAARPPPPRLHQLLRDLLRPALRPAGREETVPRISLARED